MPETYVINGLDKNDYPDLYEILLKLMNKFKIHKIRVSIKPKLNNAFVFYHFVVIGEPVIKKLKKNELEAVIAHEFSHIQLRHVLTSFFLSLLFISPFIYFSITFQPNLTSAIFWIIGLMILIYGYKVRNWITFHQEINADILAIYHTKDSKALQNALLKMELEFLTSKPSFLYSLIINGIVWVIAYIFGFTHPKITDRIQYINLLNALNEIEL